MASASKRSKREDGLYSTSVVIGRKADGKLKRKYFYAKTIKELDAKRAEFEHKFRFGLLTERENATFYEIGEEYLGYKSAFVSERTLVRNKCAFNKHLQALHPYRLQDLKATHLQMILNGLAKKGSMMVCPSADGSMMSAQGWERAWESYQHFLNIAAGGRDASRSRPKEIAIEPFTAHQLQHTYATLLYNAGVDAKSAQEMLGHADIMTTLEIYTHLSKEKKTNAISTFNQYISQCAMEEKATAESKTEQN